MANWLLVITRSYNWCVWRFDHVGIQDALVCTAKASFCHWTASFPGRGLMRHWPKLSFQRRKTELSNMIFRSNDISRPPFKSSTTNDKQLFQFMTQLNTYKWYSVIECRTPTFRPNIYVEPFPEYPIVNPSKSMYIHQKAPTLWGVHGP